MQHRRYRRANELGVRRDRTARLDDEKLFSAHDDYGHLHSRRYAKRCRIINCDGYQHRRQRDWGVDDGLIASHVARV